MDKSWLQNSGCLFSCLLLTAELVVGTPVFAQGRSAFPSDEAFERSMIDLRATMEKASSDNAVLRKQNRDLQNEIDVIEEINGKLDVEKSKMQNDGRVSSSKDVIAGKENALYTARVKNLAVRLDRLGEEKLRLQKKIKFYEDDNQSSQVQIEQLKKQIEQMQSSLGGLPAIIEKNVSSSLEGLPEKISSQENHNEEFARRVELQKQTLQDEEQEKRQLEESYDALLAEFSAMQKELDRSRAQKDLVVREVAAANTEPNENYLNEQIRDLEFYRDQLQKSLNQLKEAAAVKSVSQADLKNVLEKFEEQRALLKKAEDALKYPRLQYDAKSKESAKLLARKEYLVMVRDQLRVKIAKANKEFSKKSLKSSFTGDERVLALKNKIAQSSVRVRSLQAKINPSNSLVSLGKRSQDLTAQIEVLTKDLQALRSKSKDAVVQDVDSEDPGVLEQEIAQLQSRRDILAGSVEAIHGKYKLDDISANDPGAKEAQLKEYWDTLLLENAALQEKLLTLQMQQDKKSSPSP